MTENPSLGAALCLLHKFLAHSTTQGQEGKGVKNIGKQTKYLTDDHTAAACFSQISHRLLIHQLVLLHRYQLPTQSQL